MIRTSQVKVTFENGTTASAIVRTDGPELTRPEAQIQHDAAVDSVANVLRDLPFAGIAPLRSVEII